MNKLGKFAFGSTCFSAGFISGVMTALTAGGIAIGVVIAMNLDKESEDKDDNGTGVRVQ